MQGSVAFVRILYNSLSCPNFQECSLKQLFLLALGLRFSCASLVNFIRSQFLIAFHSFFLERRQRSCQRSKFCFEFPKDFRILAQTLSVRS